MYVIADLEWVELSKDMKSPTQLAALRVDSEWNVTDSFNSFIQPMDQRFYKWDHVAYSGGEKENFLSAPSSRYVFNSFDEWLGEDDTLLWWFSPARDLFELSCRLFLNKSEPPRSKLLGEYVTRFLYGADKRIGSYKLAETKEIERPSPEHYALNDVKLLRDLVQGISFSQRELERDIEGGKSSHGTSESNNGAYQYNIAEKRWHKKGCTLLKAAAEVVGSDSLNTCVRRGERFCACVRKEVLKLRRERMDDIIKRSTFTFGYAIGGEVFHHYTCELLRNAKEVQGCVTYQRVMEKGVRPCKVCQPSPADNRRPEVPYPIKKIPSAPTIKKASRPVVRVKPKKPRKPDAAVNRPLSDEEAIALTRLRQAQRERLSGEPDCVLMEKEKEDFYTLTQPRFAFFAAKGYRTFHLRSCGKLSGIIGVRGFDTYEAAQKAGFKPCKNCRPSPKQNISVSIPIDNRVRENESITELTLCCVRLGYEYEVEERSLRISTPVGKWILNTVDRPVTVEHINLVKDPCATVYHRQHRIFLSLRDALRYIYRHDATLQGVQWDAGAV